MARARTRPQRRRVPYWVGPASMIGVVLAGLTVVLILSSGNRPSCTRLDDAMGKKALPAAPCTIVEIKHIYLATLDTTLGKINIALQPRLAPKSVNNFIFLARAGFYDGTTFHRIDATADHALIQAGDPTGTGNGDAGYTFVEKATPQTRYVRGVVAMASSVRAPGVNGSQFFIVVRDYPDLIGASGLPTETFFGVVEPHDKESFATIDKIAKVPVDGTKPLTPIVIKRVTVVDTSVPN